MLGGGLALAGGTKSTEELIAGAQRGMLVTHFFYIRSLDPRTVLQTGLTRDGAFLIEKGKVTRPLKNFRWNESPLLMLNRLEDIGRPEPTAAGQHDAGAARLGLQFHVALRRCLVDDPDNGSGRSAATPPRRRARVDRIDAPRKPRLGPAVTPNSCTVR